MRVSTKDFDIMAKSSEMDEVLSILKELKIQRLNHEEIAFVREMIRKEKEEAEIRHAVRKRLIVGGMIALLTGFVSAVSYVIKEWMNGTI